MKAKRTKSTNRYDIREFKIGSIRGKHHNSRRAKRDLRRIAGFHNVGNQVSSH